MSELTREIALELRNKAHVETQLRIASAEEGDKLLTMLYVAWADALDTLLAAWDERDTAYARGLREGARLALRAAAERASIREAGPLLGIQQTDERDGRLIGGWTFYDGAYEAARDIGVDIRALRPEDIVASAEGGQRGDDSGL